MSTDRTRLTLFNLDEGTCGVLGEYCLHMAAVIDGQTYVTGDRYEVTLYRHVHIVQDQTCSVVIGDGHGGGRHGDEPRFGGAPPPGELAIHAGQVNVPQGFLVSPSMLVMEINLLSQCIAIHKLL